MAIEVQCPNGHLLRVKDEHAGKTGLCPHCHAKVQVPLATQIQEDGRIPLDEYVHQSPQHSCLEKESGHSSSFLLKKVRLCLNCDRIVSQSFSVCPQCATPLASYRHLKVRKEENVIAIHLGKHQIVDELTVKEVAEELSNVADQAIHCDLVLDLSNVVCLSSLMLGRLVMLQKKLNHGERRLKLCYVGPEIRKVLATTMLDQVLDIEEDEAITSATLA